MILKGSSGLWTSGLKRTLRPVGNVNSQAWLLIWVTNSGMGPCEPYFNRHSWLFLIQLDCCTRMQITRNLSPARPFVLTPFGFHHLPGMQALLCGRWWDWWLWVVGRVPHLILETGADCFVTSWLYDFGQVTWPLCFFIHEAEWLPTSQTCVHWIKY